MDVLVLVDVEAGRVTARVRGTVTLATCGELRDRLRPLLAVGARTVVVDVGQASFTDPAGPAVLVSLTREAHRLGVDLVVEHPGGQTRRLLHRTGLDRNLRMADGADDKPGGREAIGRQT